MATFIYEDTKEKLAKKVRLPNKLTDLMTQKSNYYGKLAPKLQGYKRAKKIASAAEKEAYNTNQDKFSEHDSGVTLNYNEIKRWNNALKTLPQNSDAFDANGGAKGKEMVKDLVRQVQQNSHKVPMVPEVDKLVKDIKTNDKELKPSTINNSDVYIHECKKIYLDESQLYVLQEVYNQLTIPFDNKYHEINGKQIPLKKNYEYFIDWIEHIGKYGTLPKGNSEYPSDIIDEYLENPKYFKYLTTIIIEDFEGNGYADSIIDGAYNMIKMEERFSDIPLFTEDISDAIDDIKWNEDIDDFTKYLTADGHKIFDKYIKGFVQNELTSNGFIYHSDDNFKDGLYYIERVIALPPLTDAEVTNEGDFFQTLSKLYNAVGECWTWQKDSGDAYCNYDRSYESVTLKGWVSVSDIDWKETIFLNGYILKAECEIRLAKNAMVQIDEITTNDDKHLALKGPIVVPAFSGKYWNSDNMDI